MQTEVSQETKYEAKAELQIYKPQSRGGVYERYFKRPMDFILSLLAIIFLSPLILIVAILVRTNLGSPVIFKQKRPGLNEKIFTFYKFRTMTDECDEYGELLPDEVRLTEFGRWLRSTTLDEFPQLFNILKGDMSIVGPRPLLVKYLPLYSEYERHRHDIRPGLTGLSQISGRNALRWDNRFKMDVEYVSKLSFILDVKIFIGTVLVVLNKKNILCGSSHVLKDLHVERKNEFDGVLNGKI